MGARFRAPHRPPRRSTKEDQTAGEISAALLQAIASGRSTNRADLARTLQLAPSTVTVKVAQLMSAGLVAETGSEVATGGRRSRELRAVASGASILAADLGAKHVRVGRFDVAGHLLEYDEHPISVLEGPDAVLDTVVDLLQELDGSSMCSFAGISVPGPVNVAAGTLDSPSRMPGWHRFPIADYVSARLDAPVVVDNDANMMALGEYAVRSSAGSSERRRGNILFVKSGANVGSGLVLDGTVYRGASFMAGDITHVRVSAAAGLPCRCGGRGCLETVAGGDAIRTQLRDVGIEVPDLLGVVQLVEDGDSTATRVVRAAGGLLGETLCAIVNFINPDIVVLGGACSLSEPYVSAVRSRILEGCHPLVTRDLEIERTVAGERAGLIGLAQLATRRLLATI